MSGRGGKGVGELVGRWVGCAPRRPAHREYVRRSRGRWRRWVVVCVPGGGRSGECASKAAQMWKVKGDRARAGVRARARARTVSGSGQRPGLVLSRVPQIQYARGYTAVVWQVKRVDDGGGVDGGGVGVEVGGGWFVRVSVWRGAVDLERSTNVGMHRSHVEDQRSQKRDQARARGCVGGFVLAGVGGGSGGGGGGGGLGSVGGASVGGGVGGGVDGVGGGCFGGG